MKNTTMDNSVYIGKLGVNAYVLSAMAALNYNEDCILKARGRSISKAVDVAEVLRNKFMKNSVVKNIEIGTDVMNNDGRNVNVSFIEITMARN